MPVRARLPRGAGGRGRGTRARAPAAAHAAPTPRPEGRPRHPGGYPVELPGSLRGPRPDARSPPSTIRAGRRRALTYAVSRATRICPNDLRLAERGPGHGIERLGRTRGAVVVRNE